MSVSLASGPLLTVSMIGRELRALGVHEGDTVCAHVSLKSLGFVVGGARAVIEGLLWAVGESGTLMMPTFSGDLSDPAEWRHPVVPETWFDRIRKEMPPYDERRTPTRNIGVVPELFRNYPGVLRSSHPQSSFAAYGPKSAQLVADHPLDNRFGPNSPLGKFVELKGQVLLLGSGDDTASLFHLTQHLVGCSKPVIKAAPVIVDGAPAWVQYHDVEYPIDWFVAGLASLVNARLCVIGNVGAARAALFEAFQAVEFLVKWRRAQGV